MILHGNNCAMNGPEKPASASEGEHCVDAMVDCLGLCGFSERDKTAIAFAIRCAYGLGYEDGRSRRRAA